MDPRKGAPTVLKHCLRTGNLFGREDKAGHWCCAQRVIVRKEKETCLLPSGTSFFLMAETRTIQKVKRKLRLASGPETSPSSWEEGGQTSR